MLVVNPPYFHGGGKPDDPESGTELPGLQETGSSIQQLRDDLPPLRGESMLATGIPQSATQGKSPVDIVEFVIEGGLHLGWTYHVRCGVVLTFRPPQFLSNGEGSESVYNGSLQGLENSRIEHSKLRRHSQCRLLCLRGDVRQEQGEMVPNFPGHAKQHTVPRHLRRRVLP